MASTGPLARLRATVRAMLNATILGGSHDGEIVPYRGLSAIEVIESIDQPIDFADLAADTPPMVDVYYRTAFCHRRRGLDGEIFYVDERALRAYEP